MNKEEIKHFKSLLRQGSLRHMNILLDDKFQKELQTIIEDYEKLQQENNELKKQLEYLRSGEYYNQLRFENKMLQQVVDTNGVPSEVYDYLESVHKNTEFLEQQQEFIDYLEDMLDNDNDIFSVIRVKDVLNKYKEIIGTDTNVGSKGGNEDENNSI
jgi:hypothetical protein